MDSYGVKILMAEIKQLDLPEDNKAAVYERMISERNQIAASYQAEGDSEAKKQHRQRDFHYAFRCKGRGSKHNSRG